MEYEFDYSALLGFIYSTPELGNKVRFAKYIGISYNAVKDKFNGKYPFTQREIARIKVDFNLTPEQIDRYFFAVKLLKGSIDASEKE